MKHLAEPQTEVARIAKPASGGNLAHCHFRVAQQRTHTVEPNALNLVAECPPKRVPSFQFQQTARDVQMPSHVPDRHRDGNVRLNEIQRACHGRIGDAGRIGRPPRDDMGRTERKDTRLAKLTDAHLRVEQFGNLIAVIFAVHSDAGQRGRRRLAQEISSLSTPRTAIS